MTMGKRMILEQDEEETKRQIAAEEVLS